MGQLLIRNVPDDVIETYKMKAQLAGTSLEQYLRDLIETHLPFTRAERVALTRANLAKFDSPLSSQSLDEIREGLD